MQEAFNWRDFLKQIVNVEMYARTVILFVHL